MKAVIISKQKLFVFALSLASAFSPCIAKAEKPFYVDNSYFEGKHAMNVEEIKEFFYKLKEATRLNDKDWFAENTLYPITISRGKDKILIKNKKKFKQNYKLLINELVKKAIMCQKFDDLFVNWNGIMVGQGAVWFESIYEGSKNSNNFEITPAKEKDIKKNLNDRSKWTYKIIALHDSYPIKRFVEECSYKNDGIYLEGQIKSWSKNAEATTYIKENFISTSFADLAFSIPELTDLLKKNPSLKDSWKQKIAKIKGEGDTLFNKEVMNRLLKKENSFFSLVLNEFGKQNPQHSSEVNFLKKNMPQIEEENF